MEGKRSGLGVFVIQGKRGASSQLVVNNLEQLLRTDRIYTIKWRAGGTLRCRSRVIGVAVAPSDATFGWPAGTVFGTVGAFARSSGASFVPSDGGTG